MQDAVVVASSRTPLAKSFRGSLNLTRPDDMLAHCFQHVLGKVPELESKEIEDIVVGCGYPEGAQGKNVARVAAVRAGLPTTSAAVTVNRFCASGLQAVGMAAHLISQEGAEVVLAGGVESITGIKGDNVELNPWVQEHCPGIYMVMGETAEVVAKRYRVSRKTQDEYAFYSQKRTARAQKEGRLSDELAPILVTHGIVDRERKQVVERINYIFDRDECNRPKTTLENLSKLKPHFDPDSGQGTVTAGNSSQLSDGASATLLLSRERASQLGIKALLTFRGYAVAGCEPDEMGVGPVYAVPKLLERQGLKVKDIDLWELNEAFAVQVLFCRDRLGIDPDKLNVNGGSISLGHPFGMTGSRLVGTLAYEMNRRDVRFGVVTMCVGGGQGAAALFERCG